MIEINRNESQTNVNAIKLYNAAVLLGSNTILSILANKRSP